MSSLRFVVTVWAVSRVATLAVGALATALLDPAAAGVREPAAGALDDWARWDGAWYLGLAEGGYRAMGSDAAAFFPAYPFLVGRVSALIGGSPAVAGVLVSSVALLVALLALAAVTRAHCGERAARWAVLGLACCPTSFFLGAVYTEALFGAFALGAWWALRVRGDVVLAGLLAAGAALSRNVGVLLVVPLALEWRRRGGGVTLRAAALLAPVAALGVFAFGLARAFGDPLLFATAAQGVWDRSLSNPVMTLADAVGAAGRAPASAGGLFTGTGTAASFAVSHLWNLLALGGAAWLVWEGRRLVPAGLTAYAATVLALPVLTPSPGLLLWSTPRYVLSAFPVFIVLGAVLARHERAAPAWLAACAALGALLCALFVTNRWVA